MARTNTSAPTRKVIAATGGGGLGQAVSMIFVYFLEQALGHALPDEIRLAFSLVLAGLLAFAAGYFVSPSADEVATGE